jgi:hypothetical protein
MRILSKIPLHAPLIFMFLTSLFGRLQANGPEIGFDAGSVFPVESQDIQLVREWVFARLPLYQQQIDVRCEYILCNLSNEDQTFTMGFVTSTMKESQLRPYNQVDFRVSQEHHGIGVSFAPAEQSRWNELGISVPDSLPVWEVSIQAQDSTTIQITYQALWSGGGEGGSVSKYFTYYAVPATLWAGPIESADITFSFGGLIANLLQCAESNDVGVNVRIGPQGYEWDSYGLKWEFSNWEPAENFQFMMHWYEGEE